MVMLLKVIPPLIFVESSIQFECGNSFSLERSLADLVSFLFFQGPCAPRSLDKTS